MGPSLRFSARVSQSRVLQQRQGISTGLASSVSVCVTTETRHLDRLGQLGEFEQDSNTDSEQESNTDSHSARNKAHVARQSAADAAKRHRTAKSRAPSKAEHLAGLCVTSGGRAEGKLST